VPEYEAIFLACEIVESVNWKMEKNQKNTGKFFTNYSAIKLLGIFIG